MVHTAMLKHWEKIYDQEQYNKQHRQTRFERYTSARLDGKTHGDVLLKRLQDSKILAQSLLCVFHCYTNILCMHKFSIMDWVESGLLRSIKSLKPLWTRRCPKVSTGCRHL
jgi:hypothetical protein